MTLQQPEQLNKRALQAGTVYVVCQLLVRGVSFLATPIYTRLLTPEQYGQIRVYDAWLLLLVPVLSLCLYRSVERAKYDYRDKFSAYASSILVLSFIVLGVFTVMMLLLGNVLQGLLKQTKLMFLVMILFLFSQTSLYIFFRREKQEMRYAGSAALTILSVLPSTLCSIFAIVWGNTQKEPQNLVHLRILGYYIPFIACGAGVAIIMLLQGRCYVNREYWSFGLSYSIPLIFETVSIQVMNQSDKIIIQRMVGDAAAGIYSLATTISWILFILVESVWDAWLPWLYEKISARHIQDTRKPWITLMHSFGVLSWFIVMIGPELTAVLGSAEYRPAKYLVAPLLLSVLYRFYSYIYTAVQNYHKKTSAVATTTAIAMALNVFLNIVCILAFGYQAAAYTTAFSCLFMMAAQAVMEKKVAKEPIITLRRSLKISLFYGVLILGSMMMYSFGIGIRLLMVIVAVSIFLVCNRKTALQEIQSLWKQFGKQN